MISINIFLLTYHRYILQRVCLWFRVRVQLTPTVHRSGYCVSQFAECIYIKHTTIDRWLVFIHKSFTFHHRCQRFFFLSGLMASGTSINLESKYLFFFKVIFFCGGGGIKHFLKVFRLSLLSSFTLMKNISGWAYSLIFPQSNIYSVTYMHKK